MMDGVPGVPEDPTVKMARNRFKNVLRHMQLQDSYMHDDESDSDTEEGRQGSRLSMRYPSGKKRTKSDSTSDAPKPQTSFVMKLFDRGVDLAQFDDSTPLYPICRAWMQNKPHNPRGARGEEEKEEEPQNDLEMHGETPEVHRLPPPEPLPCDDYGTPISVRIPPPLPKDNEPFCINYDDDSAPSPAVLFQNHLDRWNLIRQRWREASSYNERRYDSSFTILRQIHDRVNIVSTTQVELP
ncbi:Protein lin-37 [Orchesella cincta]|uniref:Protein lin-37 n=1 Tax=Orchesella cincta TaxID=48709 RepID=A0A1D2N6S6_ORCCI|nr:Protein lin-37 [Orchesella cincta]